MYELVPLSERKIKLPKMYLEKKDPTYWKGRIVPDDWKEEWARAQEEKRLKEEGMEQKIREMNEARRIKKLSAAKTKYWERRKKQEEKERKALLSREELSKEEIEAVKSLAREDLTDFSIFMGTEKGELFEPAWYHEEMSQELMKIVKGENDFDILMFFLPPGHGKLLADSTEVLTSEGWKTHGELKIGDFVFSPSGERIKIIGVSEKDYADTLVTFSNGESIKCHENHEWTVYDRSDRKWKTVETKYLTRETKFGKRFKLTSGEIGKRGGRYKIQLPKVNSLEFEEKILPIDAYFLGVWLGDGTSMKPGFCYSPNDSEPYDEIIRRGFVETNHQIHKITGVETAEFWGENYQILKKLNLIGNKHIPDIYKFSSEKQRLDILAGLIDTDGHVDVDRGRVRIVTVSKKLADDICELVSTLGMNPYITSQEPSLSSSGIQGKRTVYTVNFEPKLFIPTKIQRKKINKINSVERRISIVSIEKTESESGKCIEVDSEDGLYLVGRKLIPTHNSKFVTQNFSAYLMGKDPTTQIIVTSYSGELAEKFGALTRDLVESPKYKALFQTSLRKDSRSKDNWETTQGGSYNAVGIGGAVTGKRANVFIIDDLMRGRAEANSKTYRDAAWDFFMSSAFTRGANRLSKKRPVYIFCNTRWHLDDVPGRLMDMAKNAGPDFPKMKVISYPAIAETDEAHRKTGVALWEKGYPKSELEKIKNTLSAVDWSSLYQQNPITSESQEFKENNFQYIEMDEVLRKNTRRFMTIDTAISKRASGDYTGITLNFVDDDGKWNIMTWQKRISPKELIDFIFQKWEQYGIERIGIEKTVYQMAVKEFFDDEMRKRGKFPYITELQHNQTNKETRIRGLLPYYESKSVYHIKGHCEGLENELLTFPFSKHDDVIDSLAYQTHISQKPVEQRDPPKRPKLIKYK